jgi:stage II sporulation protein E
MENIETNEKTIEKISTGRFMRAAAGVSGDAAIYCGLPDGSLAFLLSDGMGKGKAAACESNAVIRRLRRLLKGNVPASKGIKIVNKAMIDKSSERESFATIDLAIIDKHGRKARFYKMGAAASFLIDNGKVRRIQKQALPIGIISKVKLTQISAKLKPGNIIIMVSDGITEADRSDLSAIWLEEYLTEISRISPDDVKPRVLSEKIVSMAQDKCGGRESDDMTAMAIIIK